MPALPAEDSTPLILALIACLDLLEPEEEAAEQATAALAASGVAPIDPAGERFDRARHRVQGRVDTDDPRQDWVVAKTVLDGWAHGDAVLRLAEVWVYRLADTAPTQGASAV